MKKVLAGGRFNILHPGHIHFLKKAKSLGDYLVVVIANDATIRSQKKSLLFPANERKLLVRSLKFVDKVVIGYEIADDSGYAKIIRDEQPDIIALGYDQKLDRKKLRLNPRIRVIRVGNFKGYKTRKLVERKTK